MPAQRPGDRPSAPAPPCPGPALRVGPSAQPVRFLPRRAAVRPVPSCANCPIRRVCLPAGAAEEAAAALLIGSRSVRRGQDLFRAGERLGFLYAVRTGSFKTTVPLLDGGEQVTALLLPGDLLGCDALANGVHTCTATALEDAQACLVPYDELLRLSGDSAGAMRMRLLQMMAAELVREQNALAIAGLRLSEPRVAAFLLMLSQRMRDRGYSPSEFELRTTRAEIGSYLGLTLESVSRAFSSLARSGCIAVSKRHVSILDAERLAALCRGGRAPEAPPADAADAA